VSELNDISNKIGGEDQEVSMANGLFSKFLNVFDVKEYEYSKEFLYFKFNAYGHLLQIKLLKDATVAQLVVETIDVLHKYNVVLNNLGVRGIERFSQEMQDKFGFIAECFEDSCHLYKEKTEAYKRVMKQIVFQAYSESKFLYIQTSADNSDIQIIGKQGVTNASEFIREFADAYQKLSVDLYELHKDIMEIIKDETMSHSAIENLAYSRGTRSSVGVASDNIYGRNFNG